MAEKRETRWVLAWRVAEDIYGELRPDCEIKNEAARCELLDIAHWLYEGQDWETAPLADLVDQWREYEFAEGTEYLGQEIIERGEF